MTEVLLVEVKPSAFRIGTVFLRYYDLSMSCDICLFKNERLWIRLPEMWISQTKKISFVRWIDKGHSDNFQKLILSKVFDMVGLTLESAIEMKDEFFRKRKKLTQQKNKFTLKEKNSEL
jgi:hypothetical protein